MQQAITHEIEYSQSLRAIFALGFVLFGTYYELCAAIISILLMAWLVSYSSKNMLAINKNIESLLFAIIWLMYLLSSIWAIDGGIAIFGAVKFLPIPLFYLCITQLAKDERFSILRTVPFIGAIMVLVAYPLHFVKFFSEGFAANGRLAGFFMYPNTFASFVLIGIIIMIMSEEACKSTIIELVVMALLGFGLVQAGSRTIFVIAIPAIVASIIFALNSERKKKFAIVLAVGIVVGIAVMFLVKSFSPENQVAIGVGNTTLLGRLLYWKDALRVIIKKPLGLGYLGYFISQGSFQTGVYTVRFAHNDLIQILIDIGWIPGLLCVYVAIKNMVSRNISMLQRIILIVLLAHAFVDFDLQFVAMWFMLMLSMDIDHGNYFELDLKKGIGITSTVAIGLLSLYIGLTTAFHEIKQDELSTRLYHSNSLANCELLATTDSVTEMNALSTKILNQSEYYAIAWDAQYKVATANGSFENAIKMLQNAIACEPYNIEEYVTYFNALKKGAAAYEAQGDTESRDICYASIVSIQDALDELKDNTDPIAWKLPEKPNLKMPQAYYDYLKEHGLQ